MYLGAAPGVGKTYAMLAEAQRGRSAGTDVVVGLVEPHGRRLTAKMAEGLETVPRRRRSRQQQPPDCWSTTTSCRRCTRW